MSEMGYVISCHAIDGSIKHNTNELASRERDTSVALHDAYKVLRKSLVLLKYIFKV